MEVFKGSVQLERDSICFLPLAEEVATVLHSSPHIGECIVPEGDVVCDVHILLQEGGLELFVHPMEELELKLCGIAVFEEEGLSGQVLISCS